MHDGAETVGHVERAALLRAVQLADLVLVERKLRRAGAEVVWPGDGQDLGERDDDLADVTVGAERTLGAEEHVEASPGDRRSGPACAVCTGASAGGQRWSPRRTHLHARDEVHVPHVPRREEGKLNCSSTLNAMANSL
ncbi:hypothetical protein GUJ93_ZPchr0007g3250 [Zizania palustris]|uniref:Uncharacterized protein n=1 Tax=Zizania palustris TaxID=103762 RepID=A0A8J5SSB7_ZIZPA|nr:hypothetical protein GUJ93_ZPchr0007g3250 [Zizania palustris]